MRLDLRLLEMAGYPCYQLHDLFLPDKRGLFIFVWNMAEQLNPVRVKVAPSPPFFLLPGGIQMLQILQGTKGGRWDGRLDLLYRPARHCTCRKLPPTASSPPAMDSRPSAFNASAEAMSFEFCACVRHRS